MTNEVKNVPELRFPGFEDEWKLAHLNDLGDFTSGGTPLKTKKSYWNGDIPWLTTGDINGKEIYKASNYIAQEGLENSSAKLIYKKAILIAMYGQGKTRGMSSILNFEAATNQACAIFQTNNDIKFMHQFFRKDYNKLRSLSNDGSQKNLSLTLLKSYQISVPKLEEQKKIGDFFSKLDRQIELEEQKLAKLEEQKKGYMQKVFSQELRFKDENGNDYPEWVEETIPQIIQLITDYVANGSFAAIRENVTYSSVEDYAYVIRLQDASANWKGPFVYTNENAYDFLKKTSLFENDIIMSNVGTVGKFFKVPKMDKPMTLGPNALLFRSESNDMNFLYFYLNSKFFKKKLKRIITPGVQSKVNKTDLKKIAIKMPKLKEQEKIGDFFSRLDEIISKQSQKIGEMKLRKKGFLQKMFI